MGSLLNTYCGFLILSDSSETEGLPPTAIATKTYYSSISVPAHFNFHSRRALYLWEMLAEWDDSNLPKQCVNDSDCPWPYKCCPMRLRGWRCSPAEMESILAAH
ncbi:elafin isoform X2 [Camelus ferus]|uniref:Elafin isoform X2 n=1 Tax=Camelus ferus TaxID=419612 RepID=A0A8B8RIE9_CAMFR|nr:elafin isoform X2 [Camelus ferus]